jgi:hypothetical protein
MDIPPPIPTVHDAIRDLDRRFLPLTIPAVRDRLKQMRGFDASPKEISAALRDFKDERAAWAAQASARAWMDNAPPDDLDGTTARHWFMLGMTVWEEASKKIRLRELGEDDAER